MSQTASSNTTRRHSTCAGCAQQAAFHLAQENTAHNTDRIQHNKTKGQMLTDLQTQSIMHIFVCYTKSNETFSHNKEIINADAKQSAYGCGSHKG